MARKDFLTAHLFIQERHNKSADVAVAQWEDQSLSVPDTRGSNPFITIGHFFPSALNNYRDNREP